VIDCNYPRQLRSLGSPQVEACRSENRTGFNYTATSLARSRTSLTRLCATSIWKHIFCLSFVTRSLSVPYPWWRRTITENRSYDLLCTDTSCWELETVTLWSSLSRQANSSSASQKRIGTFWNPMVLHRVHNPEPDLESGEGPSYFLYYLPIHSVNTLRFYGEKWLAPCPKPKQEDHPLPAVPHCVFNIYTVTLHICRHILHLQLEDTPCLSLVASAIENCLSCFPFALYMCTLHDLIIHMTPRTVE
jgi:hypothetical protein